MRVTTPQTISLDSTNVTESLYSDFNMAATYAAGNTVYVRFESDGTTPRQPTKIYESITSSNTGNYPPDDSTNWLLIGTSNKWAMFDEFVSSQTSNATEIDVTINVSKADKLHFFRLEATSVQIIVTDSEATVISDDTYDMLDSQSGSWSEYFFDEPSYKTALTHDLSAMYLNTTVQVIISGATAKCGLLVVGLSKFLGLTKYGVSASISDYSQKTTNDFGETEFVQRAYAKKMDADLWLDHDVSGSEYDRVHRLLSNLRATPCVWDGNNTGTQRESFLVFGFYDSFDLVAQFSTVSQCNLSITGLI